MTHTPALPFYANASVRLQPRDRAGRFVRVRHSAARRLVLGNAQRIRAELGLGADPRLDIVVKDDIAPKLGRP
jgi:hypothetical protein